MHIFGSEQLSSRELLLGSLRLLSYMDTLPSIAYSSLGKPFFPDYPHLHFNISNSGRFTLCAISSYSVGVDIEMIKVRNPRLFTYALCKEEWPKHKELGGDWPAFYTLWTKKEAWSKYTGRGLRQCLQSALPEDGLHFASYSGGDWRAAVCDEKPPPPDIVWL